MASGEDEGSLKREEVVGMGGEESVGHVQCVDDRREGTMVVLGYLM